MSDRVEIHETGVIEVRTGRPGPSTWDGITDKPSVFKPDVTDPDLSATIGRGRPFHFLNAYDNFFAGRPWIAGQSNTATTLTSGVSAGATVLPVASATGIIAGQHLIVAEGTAQQTIYTVASVASNNVTLTGPTTYALASGAAVTPLWINRDHLTTAGYKALAYFIANAQDAEGNYVIAGTSPKVTFLGDSWVFNPPAGTYATQITDRIPGATVVEEGVGGETSTAFLARFDTDVPADSDYVVFNEPGVNDIEAVGGTGIPLTTQLENLAELVRRIRAIGAVPIYTGHVPLEGYPGRARQAADAIEQVIGDGSGFPGAAPTGALAAYANAPDATSFGVGPRVMRSLFGGLGGNTGFGVDVMGSPGAAFSSSTGVGYQSLWQFTTGSKTTAVGYRSLFTTTSGTDNTAVGCEAGYALTTGMFNTFVGAEAGQGSTTGVGGTYVGRRAKGGATNNNGTAVGNLAIGSGINATALGASSTASGDSSLALGVGTIASHGGSVAIGRSNGGASATTSAQDEIALGVAAHTVRIAGWLRLDKGQTTVGAAGAASALPATPTKYLSVKDSAGTEYVFPVYAKA